MWAPDYVTLAEQKTFMHITGTADDAAIQAAITSASRAIDTHCNRQFGQVAAPEHRLYTAWWDSERCKWIVDLDDIMTTTGLAITVTGVGTITDYVLGPVNAAQKGRPYTSLAVGRSSTIQPTGDEFEIDALGQWGWSAVPATVQEATYLQASRFKVRQVSPWGVAGSPDAGNEIRLLARVDPDVAVSLGGLVRPRRAA